MAALAPIPHTVSDRPFNPERPPEMSAKLEAYYTASQYKMMWWRFKRHRIAVLSGALLLFFYLSIPFVEAIAPYPLGERHSDQIYAPPQAVHFFHEGRFIGPFVYPQTFNLDMKNLRRDYIEDRTTPKPIRFFCQGAPYSWFAITANFHLMCPPENGDMFLMGADRLGRDMLSRMIYGGRISLTIGLVGIAISFLLGITIGGIAGYFGGLVDNLIQRTIEILRSLPELPLWLALSAALPANWSPLLVYFGITIILGLLEWPGLARAVRSKLLALRHEDFAVASELMGASPAHIISRHLVPNFMSHLIASATLAIPAMILGETALSFLGLGLRPPITSLGVMLGEAQNIEAVALYPWLLWPMAPVILVTLAFNFLGDGLRDAADPYYN